MDANLAQTAGVDISKDALDACLHPSGATARFGNDRKGFNAMIAWLGGFAIERVVFEPTGAYHRGFERRLAEAGFHLAKVNPARARRFAEALGQFAKTDAVDASLLARMGALLALKPNAPISEELHAMRQLLVARRALIKDLVATENRAEVLSLPLLKRQAKERVRMLERQIEAVDAALRERAAADSAFKARLDIVASIPGVGELTALALLIEMPELGALEHKCAASLAGLAPFARESGRWRGERRIGGGRGHLRRALYMPALVAVRWNADLKAKYQSLLAKGKPKKLALAVVMRKLIILANALLRDGRRWAPKPA